MLKATAAGVIGQDAETRTVGKDQVTSFSVAVKTMQKDEEGNRLTQWVECSMWGERGTKLCEYLTKGSRVAVIGTLSVRTYSKKNDEVGVSVDIRVDDVTLLGDGSARNEDGPKAQPQKVHQEAPRRSRFA